MAIHHYGPLASGKPFDRPKPKLPQIITFTSTPNAPKVSPAPLLGSRPPRVNIYTFGFLTHFFFVRFLRSCTAKTARSIFVNDTSNDAVCNKEVPFGVSSIQLNLLGCYPPKTPKMRAGNRDSQLKRNNE